MDSLLFKTFKLLEHESFKDLLKFNLNYEKQVGFLFAIRINNIDISSYVAPSDIELSANKDDRTLQLIVKDAGFNLDSDIEIDLFGINVVRDFSIGVFETEYAIQVQAEDPETIRLINSELTALKLDHLDTSGFVLNELLMLEKIELNEILYVMLKLQPPQLKSYITEQIDNQLQLAKPTIQSLVIDESSMLDLTSFTELISDVDDSKLYINLAGWFENSRVSGQHPLDIGEGFYVAYQNQTQYKNQLTIHQSTLASLLNMLASTNKVFTFESKDIIDQLSTLMFEFKNYYDQNYDNVTYEIQISLDTDPSHSIVTISNKTITIGKDNDFGIEFAVIAKQGEFKQVAFKYKMNVLLVLETYMHNWKFDLNILHFDVTNVQQVANNCGLYKRDYETLFENILSIVKTLVDDTLKDGIELNIFKGRYGIYKDELAGLEVNHSFLDHFIFVGF